MSKVRIVTSTKEKTRVTSIGTITFDDKGVSVGEYDRGDIEQLVSVSGSLSIEGEKKVIAKESFETKKEVKAKENTPVDNRDITEEMANKLISENAERLMKITAESLGIEQSEIEAKLASTVKAEPSVLITVDEHNAFLEDRRDLADIRKTLTETSTDVKEVKSEEVDAPLPGSGTAQQETTKEIPPVIETKKEEIESEGVVAAREQMKDMTIDKLRDALTEAKVDESKWKSLKGKDAKPKMIDLIIEVVKSQEKEA